MSTDTDDAGDERTTKIDVRVPVSLLETIDEEYERRGYTSRIASDREV